MRRILSKYHPPEFPGIEGMSELLEVGGSDAYVADAEGEKDCDLSDFTGGPNSGQCASIRAYYDQLREMCSAANLSLPKSV